jgi:hypothetical protein
MICEETGRQHSSEREQGTGDGDANTLTREPLNTAFAVMRES